MYTFRKFRKNAKALSPVVASIILIAVTVAVSIAVAAWMGSLSTGFMQTEQVQIGTPTFVNGNATAGTITVTLKNTGTSALTIASVYVNGVAVTTYTPAGTITLQPNTAATTVVITNLVASGNNYEVKVVTAKNNPFTISATAP